mgnify:CR=1 FL=1
MTTKHIVFIGGGKAHGARLREFDVSLNKKVRALGLKMALSSRAKGGLIVVDFIDMSAMRNKKKVEKAIKEIQDDLSQSLEEFKKARGFDFNAEAITLPSEARLSIQITEEEKKWLGNTFPDQPVRAYGSMTGHAVEAQFPLGVALAAIAARRGEFYGPLGATESAATSPSQSVLVTTLGHYRSEGLGLVKPVAK